MIQKRGNADNRAYSEYRCSAEAVGGVQHSDTSQKIRYLSQTAEQVFHCAVQMNVVTIGQTTGY